MDSPHPSATLDKGGLIRRSPASLTCSVELSSKAFRCKASFSWQHLAEMFSEIFCTFRNVSFRDFGVDTTPHMVGVRLPAQVLQPSSFRPSKEVRPCCENDRTLGLGRHGPQGVCLFRMTMILSEGPFTPRNYLPSRHPGSTSIKQNINSQVGALFTSWSISSFRTRHGTSLEIITRNWS